MQHLGLNTDNFFKFLTTLSLIGTIYFFSFDVLFLEPYNNLVADYNLQKAQIAAEYGYLKGVSLDLTELVKDSLNDRTVEYFYYDSNDTSEFVTYYSSSGTPEKTKRRIDSLNLINKEYAKVLFKSIALSETQIALERNLDIKQWLFLFLGLICLITFLIAVSLWHKYRKEID